MTTLARSQEWIFNFLKLIGAEKDTAASKIAVAGQAELKIGQQFVRPPRRETETETLLIPESLPISSRSVLQELTSAIATNVQLAPAQELETLTLEAADEILVDEWFDTQPIASYRVKGRLRNIRRSINSGLDEFEVDTDWLD
jgi:hypothetical protein